MKSETESSIPRLFGTNGIRGIPNEDLTVSFSSDVGKAIGSYFEGEYIAIGRDTRITGDLISFSVIAGILSAGSSVIDLGILPTPAIQYYCKRNNVYGVVITASHNPPQFNGIKCIDKDGTELERKKEEEIERIYHNKDYKIADWRDAGNYSRLERAVSEYVNGVLSLVDKEGISKRKFKVLVDTGNGASYLSTPMMLSELGCEVVTLNANPDGTFSSRNSEPKPENLTDIMALMRSGRFDLGVAHDGDADRSVFIDENGNFIDGDKSLTLLVKSVIKKNDVVVTPISSSDSIEEVCRNVGAKLVRTKVGAPIVSRAMIREKAVIGGEENGGIIYGTHQYCRDGAMALALILNLMAKGGKKLSELIKDIPDYTIVKSSVKLSNGWEKIREKIVSYASSLKVDSLDGLKIVYDDGWVLIRPSGTEPIVRIYGQSKDADRARKLNEEYVTLVKEL